MALDAYTNATKRAANPRDIEYRVFGRITGLIMRAMESGNRVQLVKAVSENREFWTVLATDCMSDRNGLPDQVRAGIISLSIWVGNYTNSIVLDKEDPQALVDVNRSIMEGLAMTASSDSRQEVQTSMTGTARVAPGVPSQRPQVGQAAPAPSSASPGVQPSSPAPSRAGAPAAPSDGRMAPPPRPAVPPAYGPGGYGAQGQRPPPQQRPMTPPTAPQAGESNVTPPVPPARRTDIKS